MPSHRHHIPCRRRYAAAFMVGMLAFQAVGWLVAWHTARWEAKFSARLAILDENTPIRSLTLPAAMLPALHVGKREIIYAGRLYDIRSAQTQGDSVRLELYHDRHEERLYGLLDQVLSSDTDTQHAPFQTWLAKWLCSAFLMPEQPPTVPSREGSQASLQIFDPRYLTAQATPGVLAPPPDSAVSVG